MVVGRDRDSPEKEAFQMQNHTNLYKQVNNRQTEAALPYMI